MSEALEATSRSGYELQVLDEVCRARFPDPKGTSVPAAVLQNVVLSLVQEGWWNSSIKESIGLAFYNPTEWTLKEVRLEVTTCTLPIIDALRELAAENGTSQKEANASSLDKGPVTRTYRSQLTLRPESAENLTLSVLPDSCHARGKLAEEARANYPDVKLVSALGFVEDD